MFNDYIIKVFHNLLITQISLNALLKTTHCVQKYIDSFIVCRVALEKFFKESPLGCSTGHTHSFKVTRYVFPGSPERHTPKLFSCRITESPLGNPD